MTQDNLEDVKGEKARLEEDLRRRVVLCDMVFVCSKRFFDLLKRLVVCSVTVIKKKKLKALKQGLFPIESRKGN